MRTWADEKYPFIPAAMLPAWFVTDDHSIVRNWNTLAQQVLASLSEAYASALTSGRITFGEVHPQGDLVSAWACLLELDRKQEQIALAATRVMREHVEVLRRYDDVSLNLDLQALLVELRRVEGAPGVYPYVFDRVNEEPPEKQSTDHCEEFLRIGIRVAPPGGLKLRAPVSLVDPENIDPGTGARPMTHIDIVIGYKVVLWSSSVAPFFGFTCARFVGCQPAIHDATERHRLSQLEKELEEIRVTSNLAHALRTPLSNAVAAARRINKPDVGAEEARRLSGPLLAQIDEADALVGLLLFVNTNDTLAVSARLRSDSTWPTITSAMVTHQIADALMSIFHMRTDRPRDRRNVMALFATRGLQVPSEQGREGVSMAFQRLAEDISTGDAVTFALSASVQSRRFSSLEAAQLARTVALSLILTELMVNAVKHCDASNPWICFNSTVTDSAIQWTVENSVLPSTVVPAWLGEPERRSVAKREALGDYLNDRATKILGWKLERLEDHHGSICHRLVIPLEGRAAT